MLSKLLCAAALMCFATACSLAQDPTKVEPKHYKLDFENEHVQVVSVYYGPHEKSSMHDHPGGVVVCLTGAHLRFTDEHGKVREVYAKAGESRWYPPFKHKVENLGDTPYEAVYIGIKQTERVGNETTNPTTAGDEEAKQILAGYLLAASK